MRFKFWQISPLDWLKLTDPFNPVPSSKITGQLFGMLEVAHRGQTRLDFEERSKLFTAGIGLYRNLILVERIEYVLKSKRLHWPFMLRRALKEMTKHNAQMVDPLQRNDAMVRTFRYSNARARLGGQQIQTDMRSQLIP